MNKYEGLVGKVLDGRYKILELVGMGGMACVLKAQDLVMNRIVAIKILNDEYNGNEQAEARFIDESKAVAMLSNKNIVSVYDVAIYPDIKYIVMEFLDGITLREYLDNKGVIGWKEACIYTLQILRALEHAHSKGIIHRDIKPQNVILMKNGDIKVTDFGIAKLPNSVSEQENEKAVGTVYYISPEQACGQETDYYSDIYSVGIMLYEAVTGQLPFTAETPLEVAMMQVNDEPVHPKDIVLDIPVGVAQIILKAMEKSPSDRFQSAHTMAKAIEWVVRNPDVIFAMDSNVAEESQIGKTSVVSIDMIDTAEIMPYNEDELTETLNETKATGAGLKGVSDAKKKKKKKKQSKVSKTMFPIIAGISIAFILVAVVLLIMVGCEALSKISNSDDVTEVAYPELIGETFNEGLKVRLQDETVYGAKFIIDDDTEIIDDFNEEYDHNQITKMEPEPGHKSKPIEGQLHIDKLFVNKYKMVTMPYVIGRTSAAAITELEGLGLVVNVEDAVDFENPYSFNGQITDSSIKAGTRLEVGSTVTLFVCKKAQSETVKVPDLLGKSPEQAQKMAMYFGLTIEIEVEAKPDGDGKVSEMSPKPGTTVKRGTTITLTVTVSSETPDAPSFKGMTFEEAQLFIEDDEDLSELELTLTTRYFTASKSMQTVINSLNHEDIDEYIKMLKQLGCEELSEDAEESEDLIVYQSITAGKPIPPLTDEITFIIIRYEDDGEDGGDVSGGETSGETSNDESSEAEGNESEVLD